MRCFRHQYCPAYTPEGRIPGEGASKATPVRRRGKRGREPPLQNLWDLGVSEGLFVLEREREGEGSLGREGKG